MRGRWDTQGMRIILETPRLAIRQFTEDDVDNLFELNSDPAVMRYLTGGKPTPLEEIRDRIIPFHLAGYDRHDRLGTWAAESVATGEFLGWFHLRPGPGGDVANVELGYRLRRSAWHKGYATEGSRALVALGFADLGAERVYGHTMTVNTASRHVMEKCGLALVRTFPYEGTDLIEGAEHGEVEYALTRPEWESRAGPDGVRLSDGDVQEVNTEATEDTELPGSRRPRPGGLVSCRVLALCRVLGAIALLTPHGHTMPLS